jgi:hypothetical protein
MIPLTLGAALLLLALPGCSPAKPAPPADAAPGARPAGPVTFVNRVWTVTESPQVALGDIRVFLSDSTLVMASRNARPAFGTWSVRQGQLYATEEGREYPVDVLELTEDLFRIRIRGPGEPVYIQFGPAPQPAVPLQSTAAGQESPS